MDLLFIQEAVYYRFENNYYSPRIKYETYWERYLNHFKSILVLARVKEVKEVPSNYHIVNGVNVTFLELPYYNGILDFYKNKSKLKKIINKNLSKDSAFVLRVPGPIGSLVAKALQRQKIKYAVEVVGDPYEVAKFIKLPKLLRYFLMNYSLKEMRNIVKNSIAALYVTEYTLQNIYPVKKGVLSSFASNVILQESDIVHKEDKLIKLNNIATRLKDNSKPAIKIGVLGMLYEIKSPLEILEAIYNLIIEGYNIKLYYAGSGPLLDKVNEKAQQLNISANITCLGNISSGKDVFKFLDSLDLYIQFSKTEGIPRAMLEAMARGCSVISSDVGGVSEFLSPEYLVPNGDISQLSKKIKLLLSNENIYKKSLLENIKIAHKYSLKNLNEKRFNHYNKVYRMFKNNN